MVAAYCGFCALPAALGSGFALAVALMVTGCGAFVAGLSIISNRRLRIACLVTPLAIATLLGVAMIPNFRHASLQRELEALGARVTTTADSGDGVWFRYHGAYVPSWIKEQLGEAFFGEIDTIEFRNTEVPVDAIVKLKIRKTIGTLNLSFADVSKEDIGRLAKSIDASQVLLNSIDVDGDTLEEFTNMRSLVHVAAIDTNVSREEAQMFVVRNPGIRLVYGDVARGYGVVQSPPPVTEP